MAPVTFPTRDAFYDARGGARSGECDYGAHWHLPGRAWPRHGLHIVHETGDVYLNDYHSRTVEVLATLPNNGMHSCKRPHEVTCAYEVGDRLLAGWAERIYDEGGIGWLRWALQGYPVREVASDARPV